MTPPQGPPDADRGNLDRDDALARLSDSHREVILLSRIEGLPAKDVAERMGRTENAVYLLLGRALKRLSEELEL